MAAFKFYRNLFLTDFRESLFKEVLPVAFEPVTSEVIDGSKPKSVVFKREWDKGGKPSFVFSSFDKLKQTHASLVPDVEFLAH